MKNQLSKQKEYKKRKVLLFDCIHVIFFFLFSMENKYNHILFVVLHSNTE